MSKGGRGMKRKSRWARVKNKLTRMIADSIYQQNIWNCVCSKEMKTHIKKHKHVWFIIFIMIIYCITFAFPLTKEMSTECSSRLIWSEKRCRFKIFSSSAFKRWMGTKFSCWDIRMKFMRSHRCSLSTTVPSHLPRLSSSSYCRLAPLPPQLFSSTNQQKRWRTKMNSLKKTHKYHQFLY